MPKLFSDCSLQKKEMEKRKKQRELIKSEIRKAGGVRGGWGRGRWRGRGGGGTDWSMDYNQQHRQDTLELARKRQRVGFRVGCCRVSECSTLVFLGWILFLPTYNGPFYDGRLPGKLLLFLSDNVATPSLSL